MTAKFYGFERSFLHDATEEDSWVIDMVRASEYVKLESEMAALQEQVRALAAENVLVREQSEEVYAAGYNHGHLNTADGIAYAPGTKDDFYPNALQVMAEVETPATDVVIREIRALAVEGFSAAVQGGHAEADRLKHLASHYAARIRSGEKQ